MTAQWYLHIPCVQQLQFLLASLQFALHATTAAAAVNSDWFTPTPGLFETRVQEYLDSLPWIEHCGVNKFLKGLGKGTGVSVTSLACVLLLVLYL